MDYSYVKSFTPDIIRALKFKADSMAMCPYKAWYLQLAGMLEQGELELRHKNEARSGRARSG
jgi:hypothetical protein